ncbi:MAG TPA: PAS domain S-box protein [Pyrinomonadaceae bacterium]|jgi:PAS domain S-box-containing protein
MGQKRLDILHVEDNQLDADLVRETLVSQGIIANIVRVKTEDEFRTALKRGSVDLILAAYSFTALDGLTALKIARELRPEVPFIFVAGTIGEESVAEGLKSGATDYILKSSLQRLGPSIRRTLSQVAEHRERLQADQALRESEERNRLCFEFSPMPMWVYDLETLAFLAVNLAATHHYGYSRKEFLALTLDDIRPEEDVPALHSDLPAIKTGLQQSGESRHLRKDGSLIDVEITTHQMDFFGRRAEIVLANDITERKQADEARRTSEIRYRQLFESAMDGILILDGDSGKIVDVNPYLIEKLRYSREEFLDKELWQIGVFKDIATSKAAFAELQRSGYMRYDDLPLQSSDGVVTHVEVVANGYLEGTTRVIQCNIRDISERRSASASMKETNQRLARTVRELKGKREELASMTQQLWQASKLATMGELAASIAHELNNPLATVALRVESAMDELTKNDPKRHALEVISQEVERMASLVSNLLQFSRRGHPEISTLDLREELTSSLKFIEHYLRSHNIVVVHDFASHLPIVHADRQQLRQVFLNLITNASDAMPHGGKLTLRAFSGVLGSGSAAVVVEFIDNGTGVQTGDLPKLWDPFFTTKPEGKGTGLGLAICRRTVEQHRGTIEIVTGPGKGTTVRITLPASDQEAAVAA